MSVISFYEPGLQETYVIFIPIPWPELRHVALLFWRRAQTWKLVSQLKRHYCSRETENEFFFFFGRILFPCPGSNLGHSSDSTQSWPLNHQGIPWKMDINHHIGCLFCMYLCVYVCVCVCVWMHVLLAMLETSSLNLNIFDSFPAGLCKSFKLSFNKYF